VLPELEGSGWVLELGHGPGHLQQALSQRGRPTAGLDRSPQMGRQARRRLLAARQPVRLVQGVAQDLPFAEAAFSHAVATFPTDYFLHSNTMAEVYRVLAPGGRWVVVPVAWVTGGALRQRLSAFLFRVTGESPPYEDEAWIDRYAQVFRKAGFIAQAHRKSLPGSEVLVIVAERPSGRPSGAPGASERSARGVRAERPGRPSGAPE
jgi:ubiquinone/menaquinone biosynthesis C-methylase UbiE